MNSFAEMMDRLKAGTFTDPIPHSIEKAGVITPSGLLRLAIHGQPDDPYTSALLEAIAAVLEQVYDYIEEKILGDEKTMERAQCILGTETSRGEPPLGAEDLIMVRISWRMEQQGEKLHVGAWYTLTGGVTVDPETSAWEITWPELQDDEAQFWPVRYLREALKLCLFSGALRAPTTPTQH